MSSSPVSRETSKDQMLARSYRNRLPARAPSAKVTIPEWPVLILQIVNTKGVPTMLLGGI